MRGRGIALLCALALAFTLAACGSNNNGTDGGTTNGGTTNGGTTNGTNGTTGGTGAQTRGWNNGRPAGTANGGVVENGDFGISRPWYSANQWGVGDDYLRDGRYTANTDGTVIPGRGNRTGGTNGLLNGTRDVLDDVGNGVRNAARDVTR